MSFTESLEVTPKKCDVSVSDILVNFDRLRLSALTKAAEISPVVKEVTIGPNSPVKKSMSSSVTPVQVAKPPQSSDENLIEDKIGEELRYAVKMREYEAKLQENSEIIFKSLIEKMIAKRAETMAKYWKKQSEECERKALELKARKLKMLQELQDSDHLSIAEKAKLDEQNNLLINRQTIENMNRILEEQNKATARFASITDSHTKICISYNELTNILQSDPIAQNILDKYKTTLDSTMSNINSILDLCKTGTITDKEVKQSEVLVSNINSIKQKILEDLNEEIKRKEIIKQQEDEQNRIKQIEAKKAQEANELLEKEKQVKAAEKQNKTPPLFYAPKNYSYFEELQQFLHSYENQYKAFLEDTALKKFRFDCQKAVNIPLNAISSVSGEHLKDKYDKLSKLLKGEQVQVLDTYVKVSQHPQGLAYVTALLAKKIVKQGDLLVSSKPEAAFPLAAVTVALWSQFPELGKLLEAYFHKECPYLVPMFLPQKQGQTDKEFYMSRGYTYSEDGVEKQDKFLKRMSGIFRLRCAIWICRMPKFITESNPHSLGHGWQWLASFINLKPEPDICATLLHDFFTVCGSQFFVYYGKQFIKIIKLICTDYLKILEKIDEGGPKTRLEVFLQDVLKQNTISPPRGLLPANIW